MVFVLIAVVAIVAAAAFAVIAYRREWRWSGLPADPGDGSPTRPARPAKTLWDWLQLLVVPLVLALAAFALNAAQSDRDLRQEDRRAARQQVLDERRAGRELAGAADRAREDTLRTYIQQMSDLLTRRDARASAGDWAAGRKTLARTLTLVALRRLDGKRKGLVVQFLVEARLMTRTVPWHMTRRDLRAEFDLAGEPKVSLAGADLRGAVIPRLLGPSAIGISDNGTARTSSATFMEADLRGADLHGALLAGVSFEGANLRGAKFDGASLIGTAFFNACLSGATFVGARDEGGGSDFNGAAGSGIDFSNASLKSALLANADFTNVKLTRASTGRARWPHGPLTDAHSRKVCSTEG